MSRVFGIFVGVAALLYVIAEMTLEHPGEENTAVMRWATDPNPARKVQIAKFSEMNPGLDAVVDPGIGGDQTKLIVQCATGTGPDIIDTGLEGLPTLVQAGILLDLTPYAQGMGFSLDQTYPALSGALRIEGKQYAFPCNVWANAVIYNRKVFDDHGVAYPKPGWTLEDFIAAGQAIKNTPSRSGEEHIAVANWYGMWIVQDMFAGLGGRYFSEDGLTCLLDSPEAVKAFQNYHDLMWEHGVLPTAAELAGMSAQGGWGSYGLTLFSSGKAAMLFCGRWYLVQVPNYPDLVGNLGAAALPRLEGRESAGMGGTRCAGINIKSRYWREALRFLKYLASPEYNGLIAADGDALPPNPHVARTGEDLRNRAAPEAEFHQVFIDAMERARPVDISPFVDSQSVLRWFNERVGAVENQIETPREACEKLSREVNRTIRVNLERRLDLRRKFEKATGRPYSRDWWKKAREKQV